MVVASGQMLYQYDSVLPIRTKPGAWPGLNTPNIGPSGDIIEQAMFVLNAELRKWNVTSLSLLTYQAYSHPDLPGSGFEPKDNGQTLIGLVGVPALLTSNNIEQMRDNLGTHLFSAYANDSVYGSSEFLNAWLKSAYPESPSGDLRIIEILPIPIFSLIGRTFLRPPLENITNGNLITTTDMHWLMGSGTLFDIDIGEVIFNPFPFPGTSNFFSPSANNLQIEFSPTIPTIQTTLGNIPSVLASRYQSDVGVGTFKNTTNFAALESGYMQIDGYVLLPETTIELVRGNDFNFEDTVSFSNDFTGHIQGLRRVSNNLGQNDASARCYRLPTTQNSGLYRLLTHNQRVHVPFTAIPSGFVSIWPQGNVIKSNTGLLVTNPSNFIDGQQYTITSDGGLKRAPTEAKGVHVFDDAIWLAGPNDSTSSGTFDSRGLTVVSPFTGSFVWYRPAERILSTSGTFGPGPAHFGNHLGLFELGTDFVRISKTGSEFFTFETSPTADTGVYTIHWQRYNQTTLNHIEESKTFTIIEDGLALTLDSIGGAIRNSSNIYIWNEINTITRFTTGLNFDGYFRGPIAGRRHVGGSQLLYTRGAGGLTVGDPLLAIGATNIASGIGKWSISIEPADIFTDSGEYIHTSAKPLRAEAHFGFRSATNTIIHSIFDIIGATHVPNGTWMIIQFQSNIFLCRIVEESTEWRVVESMQLRETVDGSFTGTLPDEFPFEGILHEID